MAEENTAAAAATEQEEQKFIIQRIYIKDVSFESPNTPDIYAAEWDPDTNLEMSSKARTLNGEGYYEVELQFTITVKNQEQTAFLVEVNQAGIFEISGYSATQLNQLLASYCPTTLFPYAREAIASLVSKGSFPELHLSPINFDALYAQRMAESQQEEPEANATIN